MLEDVAVEIIRTIRALLTHQPVETRGVLLKPTLAIRDQVIPPTINYETPDPECGALDFTPNVAKKREVRVALSNSAGFGGHNVSLAVKRFTE